MRSVNRKDRYSDVVSCASTVKISNVESQRVQMSSAIIAEQTNNNDSFEAVQMQFPATKADTNKVFAGKSWKYDADWFCVTFEMNS